MAQLALEALQDTHSLSDVRLAVAQFPCITGAEYDVLLGGYAAWLFPSGRALLSVEPNPAINLWSSSEADQGGVHLWC
jgi:hypothetical protein